MDYCSVRAYRDVFSDSYWLWTPLVFRPYATMGPGAVADYTIPEGAPLEPCCPMLTVTGPLSNAEDWFIGEEVLVCPRLAGVI